MRVIQGDAAGEAGGSGRYGKSGGGTSGSMRVIRGDGGGATSVSVSYGYKGVGGDGAGGNSKNRTSSRYSTSKHNVTISGGRNYGGADTSGYGNTLGGDLNILNSSVLDSKRIT